MSLKEIKARITSVQSTQKITSAMRMVASAKLHRTQQMTQNFLIYIDELKSIVESLGATINVISSDVATSENGQCRRSVALIPISSGSGLCGAFNSNIVKTTLCAIKEYKAQGIEVTIFPIGKKVAHDLRREGYECNTDFILLAEEVGKEDIISKCRNLINHLHTLISASKIDSVEFVYHHFKSMGKQNITRELIELEVPIVAQVKPTDQAYICEPSPQELISELHPKMLNSKVYSILLDSVTSEHAARMMAMQTADDNAKELLQELTLLYNKSRQQAITNELIDIMGGKISQ